MKVAITGTPGVGKTTVAREVGALLHLQHIEIAKFAREWGAVIEEEDGTLIVDEDILKERIDAMDDVVIDSHFSEIFNVDYVFVLRCEPKILYERLKERGYSLQKVKENVLAEILDSCLINALQHHPPQRVFEINENPVEEIVSIVKNPSPHKSLLHGSKTAFLTEENLTLVE